MIGRSKELEDVGRVASSFPTYIGKIEATLLAGYTESSLQDVELGHKETVYLGSTLGLILNCFVKHYGSKFLISGREALCLILEPYYDCFLVP